MDIIIKININKDNNGIINILKLFCASKAFHCIPIFTIIMQIFGILDMLTELLYFPRAFLMYTRAAQRNAIWHLFVSARLQLHKVAGK